MPAEWTFGVHVCRHARLREFADPVQIRTMMGEMERHDLPYSSVIIEGWNAYDENTYDGMNRSSPNYQKHRPDGGMCFSRGGGIGAQRYPFLWCGDQLREWRFLGAILSATLSLGVSGIPFVSHDLGGYMPTEFPQENDEARVFIRGTQMACFSLNMQTHGIVTRPYDFDAKTVALYRAYSRIHYTLIPYLREYAQVACETGVPVLRHLFLDHPDDTRVYGIEDQYLLGDDLLVAPILHEGNTRQIYLPEGAWFCLYTGEKFTGETLMENWSAPLSRIPVFVREERRSRTLDKVLPGVMEIVEGKTDGTAIWLWNS